MPLTCQLDVFFRISYPSRVCTQALPARLQHATVLLVTACNFPCDVPSGVQRKGEHELTASSGPAGGAHRPVFAPTRQVLAWAELKAAREEATEAMARGGAEMARGETGKARAVAEAAQGEKLGKPPGGCCSVL